MCPDIPFGVKLRRLLDAFHALDFRQHLVEQRGFIEQFKSAAGAALDEHFCEFVAHTLAAYCIDKRGERTHGAPGFRLDFEAEAGGEAHTTQHAQMVFFKAQLGAADGANDAGIEIRYAAYIVDDGRAEIAGAAQRVEEQAVDGEVAALHVFLGSVGVANRIGMAAVGICAIGAEGRHFGDRLLAS